MKQHITVEQLNELSIEQKKKLFKALFPKVYSDPRSDGTVWVVYDINHEYLTIGQMIEFLDDKQDVLDAFQRRKDMWVIGAMDYEIYPIHEATELCDALWKAVKEVLMTD